MLTRSIDPRHHASYHFDRKVFLPLTVAAVFFACAAGANSQVESREDLQRQIGILGISALRHPFEKVLVCRGMAYGAGGLKGASEAGGVKGIERNARLAKAVGKVGDILEDRVSLARLRVEEQWPAGADEKNQFAAGCPRIGGNHLLNQPGALTGSFCLSPGSCRSTDDAQQGWRSIKGGEQC